MKTFRCTQCEQVLYFESTRCVSCQSELNYLPDIGSLFAMAPLDDANELWTITGCDAAAAQAYRRCNNQTLHGICNWAIPASLLEKGAAERAGASLCAACDLNTETPVLDDPVRLEQWRRLEVAKRRLLYSLTRLGLSFVSRRVEPAAGLGFRFVADGQEKVLTGHADGLITINVAEADASVREQTREQLGEQYRTLLGHFRHESGHYYWDRLIKDGEALSEFRALFGDERADYDEAIAQHYSAGAPAQRALGYVSAYASMHPWEDWAETWAHYLHMVDTVETAQAYGLAIARNVEQPVAVAGVPLTDFDALLSAWVPLTLAMNSLNRSMGLADPYPFTLDDGSIRKLQFVHDIIATPHCWPSQDASASPSPPAPGQDAPVSSAVSPPGKPVANV